MLLAESIISLPWGIKLSVYGNGLSPEKSIQGFEFEQPAGQSALASYMFNFCPNTIWVWLNQTSVPLCHFCVLFKQC